MNCHSTPKLFYFQCSLCLSIATSPVFSARYECVGCRRWMRFLYRVDAVTPEQQQLVARGLVYNPHTVPPLPWDCVRCGQRLTDLRPTYRTDGKCCRECVKAEAGPPKLRSSTDVAIEDAERLEAAYRAAEKE